MSDPHQVQAFDPRSLQDTLRERVKSIFGELVPDDVWNQMISSEIDKCLKTDLPTIVKAVFAEKCKEMVKLELEKPEWQTIWTGDHFPSVDGGASQGRCIPVYTGADSKEIGLVPRALIDMLMENQGQFAAMAIQGTVGNAMGMALQGMRQNLQQIGRY